MWIQTFTGKKLYPLDPDPLDICIEDIAHSLSYLCRYNGHGKFFYSVSEHSVIIAQLLERYGNLPRCAPLIGLLHDAPEGLGLCDIPSPIKPYLENYEDIENTMMYAVLDSFRISEDDYILCKGVVKGLDTRILMDERAELFDKVIPWITDCEPLGVAIECWNPEVAEKKFLEAYEKYK